MLDEQELQGLVDAISTIIDHDAWDIYDVDDNVLVVARLPVVSGLPNLKVYLSVEGAWFGLFDETTGTKVGNGIYLPKTLRICGFMIPGLLPEDHIFKACYDLLNSGDVELFPPWLLAEAAHETSFEDAMLSDLATDLALQMVASCDVHEQALLFANILYIFNQLYMKHVILTGWSIEEAMQERRRQKRRKVITDTAKEADPTIRVIGGLLRTLNEIIAPAPDMFERMLAEFFGSGPQLLDTENITEQFEWLVTAFVGIIHDIIPAMFGFPGPAMLERRILKERKLAYLAVIAVLERGDRNMLKHYTPMFARVPFEAYVMRLAYFLHMDGVKTSDDLVAMGMKIVPVTRFLDRGSAIARELDDALEQPLDLPDAE